MIPEYLKAVEFWIVFIVCSGVAAVTWIVRVLREHRREIEYLKDDVDRLLPP